MKLVVLFSILLTHLSGIAIAQLLSEPLYPLKGKVKSVRHTAYSVQKSDQGIQKDKVKEVLNGNNLLMYNRRGQLIEKHEFDIYNAQSINKTKYIRNSKGMIITTHTGIWTYQVTYRLDKQNHITEAVWKDDTIPLRKLIHTQKCDNTQSAIFKQFQGYPSEEISFNPKGTQNYKILYLYDSFGNLIDARMYNQENWCYNHLKYEYDKNHNLIKISGYDPQTEKLVDEQRFEYIFDAKGNWVRQVCYENSYIRYLIERTIEYY